MSLLDYKTPIQADPQGLNKYKVGSNTPDYLSESDAISYALKMGFSDSFRGIQQIYGNITGADDLLEKLSEKDKKLKAIFENPEYGSKAFGAYMGGAFADPIGLIPFLGWAKKINGIGKATAFGAGQGAFASGIAYQGEEQNRLDSTLWGAGAGSVLGLGGSALAQGIGKVLGKTPKFAKTTKQRQEDILDEQADLIQAGKGIEAEEEIDNLTKQVLAESKRIAEKDKGRLGRKVEQFWKEQGADKIWDIVGKNWGSSLAGAFGGVAGYNAWNDPEATEGQKMFAAFLLGASGVGATKVLGKNIKVGKDADQMELREFIARQLVDNYGLPKDYLDLKRNVFGQVNSLASKFHEASVLISRLSTEDKKIVNAMLTGDIDSVSKADFKRLKGFSDKARKIIKETGQELVDSGLLSEKVFKKNAEKYLHRTYSKYLKGETSQEAVGAARFLRILGSELKPRGYSKELTLNHYNKFKNKQYKEYEVVEEFTTKNKKGKEVKKVIVRRDLTKEERLAKGEIEDAAFNVAETGRLMTNDLAAYKLYANISNNKKISLDESAFANKVASGEVRENDWIQMPDNVVKGLNFGKNPIKTYGQLSGKFVPKDVYRDLTKINKFKEKEGFQAAIDAYDSITRLWKKSKTAWNPTVHINNTMSNLMLIDFAGGTYRNIPRGYSELLKGLDGDPKAVLYKLAKENGVFDVDLVSKELTGETRNALEKAIPALRKENNLEAQNAVDYSKDMFKTMIKYPFEKAEKLYQLEDQIFRMGLFMDRLEQGFSIDKAAADAKKWFIDYDINAPFVNAMRRTAVPFLSYTYRVVPLLAEAAVYRPWKFAKWAGIGYGLNEAGTGKVPFAEFLSDDPEFGRFKEEYGDEEAERIMMRKDLQKKLFGLPFMPDTNIKTPFKSSISERKGEDVPLYIDVKRFIPGGDVLNTGEGIGIPLDILPFTSTKGKEIPLPSVLTPNFGALGEIMIPILTGVDPFTKQKIDGLGLGNDGAVLMDHIISRLTPNVPLSAFTVPFLPKDRENKAYPDIGLEKYNPFKNTFSSKKIRDAYRQALFGAESDFGAELSPGEAILNTFGFKLQAVEIAKLLGIKSKEFQSQYSKIRQGFYTIQNQYRQGKISQAEAEKQLNALTKQYNALIKRNQAVAEKYKEATREKRVMGGVINNPENLSFAEQSGQALEELQKEYEEKEKTPVDKQMKSMLDKGLDIAGKGLDFLGEFRTGPQDIIAGGVQVAKAKKLLDEGKPREAFAEWEKAPIGTQLGAYALPGIGEALSGAGAVEYGIRASETEGLEKAGNVAMSVLEAAGTLPVVGALGNVGSTITRKFIKKGIKENNSPTKTNEYYEANEKKQIIKYEPTKEVADKFQELANAQRGEPEITMVKAQKNLKDVATGVYPFYLEHVGDLTNRLSDMYGGMSTDMPFHDVISKIEKTSFHNSGDELYKEIMGNIQNNLRYAKENNKLPQDFSVDDAMKLIRKEGQEYADKHKALKVYNEPQYLAREAAVALGEFRLNDYNALIKSLKEMSETEELYKKGSQYFTDSKNNIITYDEALASIDEGGAQATQRFGKTQRADLDKQMDELATDVDNDVKFISPTLKVMLERGPQKIKGKAILDWVRASRNKGVKPKEVEYLKIEEYVKANPEATFDEVIKAVSPNRVKIDKNVRDGEFEEVSFNTEPHEFDPLDGTPLWEWRVDEVMDDIKNNDEYIKEDIVEFFNRNYAKEGSSSVGDFEELYDDVFINGKTIEFNGDVPSEEAARFNNSARAELAEPPPISSVEELTRAWVRNNYMKEPYHKITVKSDEVNPETTFAFGDEEVGYSFFVNGERQSGYQAFSEGEAQVTLRTLIEAELGIGGATGTLPMWKNQVDRNLPGGNNYKEYIFEWGNENAPEMIEAVDTHYGATYPNYLAHALVRDRTVNDGSKVLHIDELQSDLHQKGNDRGYATPETKKNIIERLPELASQVKIKRKEIEKYMENDEGYFKPRPSWVVDEVKDFMNRFKGSELRYEVGRLVRKDFEENKEFFNLLDEYIKVDNEYVDLIVKQNTLLPDYPLKDNWHEMGIKRLLAEAVENNYDAISVSPAKVLTNRWAEKNKDFYELLYDKRIPSYMQKLARQYGGKFEKGKLDIDDTFEGSTAPRNEDMLDVNILKITPEMRENIMEQGLEAFNKGGRVRATKGGVFDVPYTKEDPADRINVYTQEPYRAKTFLETQLEELLKEEE